MSPNTDPQSQAPQGFVAKFAVLKTAPRELWLVFFGKVMETAAYGLFNMGLMLYLINDLHFSDEGAGSFVGLWATLISLFTFLVGSLSDAVGIRKTLIFSFALAALTRGLTGLIGHPWLAPALGLIPMTLAVAMTIPVMVAATRRFTNTRQRSMAFSLLYVLMNLGFLISGKLFDLIRASMGQNGRFNFLGFDLSVYETIFMVASGFTLLGLLPVVFLFRPGAEMPDEGEAVVFGKEGEVEGGQGALKVVAEVARKTLAIFSEVFKEKAFYRFLLLLSIIVGVRMVFYHMHYTLPPWADRELGYGSRFGTAWGVINPLLIMILTPIIGALSGAISSYRMIIVGTSLSALPVFLLALPGETFAFLQHTFLGDALKHFLSIDGELAPLYFNLVFFAIIFSLGEAIWSPRLYEYTASVAPKGREATYMGLSLLPMFLAKLVVGPLSGVLIGQFCPADGARNSEVLWLVVAVMAASSPLLLLLLRRVIQPRANNNDADLAPAEAVH